MTEEIEMEATFFQSLIAVGVRRGLSLVGGGAVLSDTQMGTIVGAVMIVGDLLWQAWLRYQAMKPDTVKPRP